MKIFNTEIPKRELLRRVGNLAQVGGVQLLSHEQGYARGSRFLEFRTGSGFRFGVNVDRGMDPGYAEFNGASLAWLAPKIFPAPSFWENDDHAWVRFILGGLCNTAGLVTIGNPQTVDVSHFSSTRATRIATAPTTVLRSCRPVTSTSVSAGRTSAVCSGPRARCARRSSTARICC